MEFDKKNKELITKKFFFCEFFFSLHHSMHFVLDFYPHTLFPDIANLSEFLELLKEVKANEIDKT